MTTGAQGYCISSLAEGAEVWLIGAGWECRGLWRWERVPGDARRMPARRKVWWDTEDRVPRQIHGLDRPRLWRPLNGLPRATPLRGAGRAGRDTGASDSASRSRPDALALDGRLAQSSALGGRLAQSHAPAGRLASSSALGGRLPEGQSPSALEARILLAFRVDRALPDRERSLMRVRANWPATGYEPGDYPPQITTRFRASPAQVDDYLVVMKWVAQLEALERRALLLRSLGLTFKTIAERLGGKRDEHGARRVYKGAIERVGQIAAKCGAERATGGAAGAAGGRAGAARSRGGAGGARDDGARGDRG